MVYVKTCTNEMNMSFTWLSLSVPAGLIRAACNKMSVDFSKMGIAFYDYFTYNYHNFAPLNSLYVLSKDQ